MKKLFFFFAAVQSAMVLFAQPPQSFKYQAVVRDNSGNVIANQNVSFRIGILQGSPSGTLVYSETHSATANDFGLVNLEIGNGTVVSGVFANIAWASGSYFLQLEIDETGGTNFQVMGTSQLLSVPYALYSASTGDTSAWRKSGLNDLYYNQGKVGIGWQFPVAKLDVRGSNPDEPVNFLLGATDLSHRLLFSGGRTSDPNPFIQWKQGDSLRFGTDESGGIEVLRITNNGKVGIGITRPKWSLDIAGSINMPSDSSYRIGGTSVLCVRGFENTFVGWYTGISNTLGYQNTAIGSYALTSNTEGLLNTACGHGALQHNTTGSDNTAFGVIALAFNSTGYQNTACGIAASKYNTDGDYNTALGAFADYSSNSDYNTSIGYNTGATYLYSTSTFLGAYASPDAGGYSNCMALGYDAKVTASNKVVIGNSNVTSIGGYVGWTNFSDGRYKKNISEDVPGLAFINQLRPVSYNLDVSSLNKDLHKNKPTNLRGGELPIAETPDESDVVEAKERIVYTGFIAQEVEATARGIGYEFSGVDAPENPDDFYGLRYAEFVVPLVKAVQEQQVMIEELKQQNERLLNRIEVLESK